MSGQTLVMARLAIESALVGTPARIQCFSRTSAESILGFVQRQIAAEEPVVAWISGREIIVYLSGVVKTNG